MLYHEIQVICLFRDIDWEILNINTEINITKEEFLRKVFRRLNKRQINRLEKLSMCQFCDNDAVQPFITECCGQLWFDLEDNENRRIRDQYLADPYSQSLNLFTS